jgi:hypothetical protein
VLQRLNARAVVLKPRAFLGNDKGHMFTSVRRRFRRGDTGWLEYIDSVDLPQLSEVRTIDSALNHYAAGAGDIECTPDTLAPSLNELPIPNPSDEYCLLAINLSTDSEARVPAGWKLLGHDLSDETQTSSLLNCGPWQGKLKPFTRRLNDVGLLSRADAELAVKLIPIEWGKNMDHGHATIWALYERE